MGDQQSSSGNTFSPEDLRKVFGGFATGVTAICARHEGKDYGITVNSYTSLSLDPPLVLFCGMEDSQALQIIRASGAFSVNILAADQESISNQLARKGGPEKMAGIERHYGQLDTPLLEGALGSLECRLHQTLPGGDHVIVIGEVVGAELADAVEPLLFHRSRYGRLATAE